MHRGGQLFIKELGVDASPEMKSPCCICELLALVSGLRLFGLLVSDARQNCSEL